jgi:Tol biopolymer transport system component
LVYDEATSSSGTISADLDIWRMPGPVSEEQVPPTRLIDSSGLDWLPVYSPGGTQIAFTSERAGTNNIFVCDSDGANCAQLTDMWQAAKPIWSPDGKSIAFSGQDSAGDSEAWVVGVEEGLPRRVTHEDAATTPLGWSRDGRWLYFISERTGSPLVWKMPVEGGEARQITQHLMGFGEESEDGRFFYLNDRYPGKPRELSKGFWKVPVDGGEETLVLEEQLSLNSWDLWRNNLVYMKFNNGPAIEMLDLETSEVTELPSPEDLGGFGLSVSPDGRWILYTRREGEGKSDIILVENFH